MTAQPLIESLSRLSEQDRRAISRGLRLLRKALDPEAEPGEWQPIADGPTRPTKPARELMGQVH